MNTQLPVGYYARPVCMNDLADAVKMFNAYSRSQVGTDQNSLESIQSEWQSPWFDLSTDTMAVFTPEGQIAAYTEFLDRSEPHIRLFSWAAIHPEQWQRGLGSFLLEWAIECARQSTVKAPPDARVVMHVFAEDHNLAAADLFTCYGFQQIRSSYLMRIDFAEIPQPPTLPDGITIRSITNEAEERAALYASYEAFKDHWGHTNEPFEEFYKRKKYYLENDPNYDPDLWFIALDGEEVAGISLCYPHLDEDPDMAWVGTLGVRRPWRKRGLGLALLQHSFYMFSRLGKPRAGLGVDASSLTGAVRLYERAGMHIWRKSNLFELEIRPGIEMMTQAYSEE